MNKACVFGIVLNDEPILSHSEKFRLVDLTLGSIPWNWFIENDARVVIDSDVGRVMERAHAYGAETVRLQIAGRTFSQRGKRYSTAAEASKSIFFRNTEIIRASHFVGPVTQFIGVAAGLRPLSLLYRAGFNHDTKVLLCDISELALKFHQFLVNTWDGNDYPSAISIFRRNNPELVEWHPSREADEHYWNQFLRQFGSLDSWQTFWTRYRKLSHVYLKQDIRTISADGLKYIDPGHGVFFWISNCFTYAPTKRKRLFDRFAEFDLFINRLTNYNPQIWIHGQDCLTGHLDAISCEIKPPEKLAKMEVLSELRRANLFKCGRPDAHYEVIPITRSLAKQSISRAL